MCKINGMLPQLIQVAGIHIIQSRSPEAGFSKGIIQQSCCMRGASSAWRGQQGFGLLGLIVWGKMGVSLSLF